MVRKTFNPEVSGFIRTKGKKLINGDGQELLLRGVGFGSWMLPEGYMWRFPEQGDRPRRIEAMVRELVGEEQAGRFWDIYYDIHTAEADIRQIAAEGMNSVRIPINARWLMEEGDEVVFREKRIALLDRVIDWCRDYKLYVVLDLHGAPGGQTGANIDDSANDQPELFLKERYQRQTIELWRMLADRYKDEWIVAGYDLLNEPLPNWFAQYNDRIMPLYKRITAAIREVDERHMIILEGAHWATDWTIFDERFDDNVLLQFHKYWNNPDTASLQKYLDKRDEWDAPLYMGEGGENNKDWYAGAFRLFEDHDISWNFWTWKKMGKDNSPCEVRIPDGWDSLVAYLQGGVKPDAAEAERILWQYLDNLRFENCVYHADVVNALLRRPPVRIPAIFYGYKGAEESFHVGKPAESNVGFRVADGTDIRFVTGEREQATFEHGQGQLWQDDERMYLQLAAGDWAAYEFVAGADGAYAAELRLSAAEDGAELAAVMDGETLVLQGEVPTVWKSISLWAGRELAQGPHKLILQAKSGSVRLEWLEIRPV
ncbi:cellulase family glycosylhydrolase [Paenibacillus athensensis]|uniref:Glycoside hydrolase n=1 Tax=Paenibacillus athensensis TaxID=1967502 RepID=A0A4Y8PZ71_9BACL|nr:cellulase family glycosylhydrolase [Paenibacillus athensensis]MCD1259641.1 cellulase family glycosylhydrolase [Paenibacillus athensensis]